MSARRISIVAAAASVGVASIAAGSVYAHNTRSVDAHNTRRQAVSALDPGVVAAQAAVTKAKAIPKFVAPGPVFNARAAKGKTIFVIPFASTVPQAQAVIAAQRVVAKKLGFQARRLSQSRAAHAVGPRVTAGIARKADAIILEGT